MVVRNVFDTAAGERMTLFCPLAKRCITVHTFIDSGDFPVLQTGTTPGSLRLLRSFLLREYLVEDTRERVIGHRNLGLELLISRVFNRRLVLLVERRFPFFCNVLPPHLMCCSVDPSIVHRPLRKEIVFFL